MNRFYRKDLSQMQSTKIYKIDEIPQDILDTIDNDFESKSYIDDYCAIYRMQQICIKKRKPDSYFVAGFVDEVYLGGTVLFLKGSLDVFEYVCGPIKQTSPKISGPLIEGIAKSQKGLSYDIKLNSLIIPATKKFLLDSDYHSLYVNPVPRQSKILLNHYGFRKYQEDSKILIIDF